MQVHKLRCVCKEGGTWTTTTLAVVAVLLIADDIDAALALLLKARQQLVLPQDFSALADGDLAANTLKCPRCFSLLIGTAPTARYIRRLQPVWIEVPGYAVVNVGIEVGG
jgi:hypothetical protein